MEELKKDISKIMEDQSKEDDNQFRQIIPILIKKGLDNLDLSMFNESMKIKLLTAAGDEYLKRGNTKEALKIFK